MIHFFKLVRPINLLIILLTMFGTRFYILQFHSHSKVDDNPFNFALLVLSTLFIAAAGNIINDYFDVKADRINKPEKLILTKHVKRRYAIISHWALNLAAFGIGCYLSYYYGELSFAFIHLVSINILWFYSMVLKRKPLIGNLLIAGLTGMIPLLVAIYFRAGNYSTEIYNSFDPSTWVTPIDYSFVYLLAFFAFIQNLIREVIKDVQDIPGDQLIYVKSLPMLIGLKTTLFLTLPFLLILPVVYCYVFFEYFLINKGISAYLIISLPFLLSAFINLFLIGYIIMKREHSSLKLVDRLIKITMLVGVLSTFHLGYFFHA